MPTSLHKTFFIELNLVISGFCTSEESTTSILKGHDMHAWFWGRLLDDQVKANIDGGRYQNETF